jgi:hypothetical protein
MTCFQGIACLLDEKPNSGVFYQLSDSAMSFELLKD